MLAFAVEVGRGTDMLIVRELLVVSISASRADFQAQRATLLP
jgi:hypothetical protein